MIPTYPQWEQSAYAGVQTTTMQLFNKREEIEYYEIGVFDESWKPLRFVTSYSVLKVAYLEHALFDIYMRNSDASRAVYICSRSKVSRRDSVRTAVSSRICSKIKKEGS
jgi:hypothetical protein